MYIDIERFDAANTYKFSSMNFKKKAQKITRLNTLNDFEENTREDIAFSR